MTFQLYIGHYEFVKENVTSSYIFHLLSANCSSTYNLQIPSNPLVDIEILKFNNNKYDDLNRKINHIIKSKKYCYKTTEELKNFLVWINSKINLNTVHLN